MTADTTHHPPPRPRAPLPCSARGAIFSGMMAPMERIILEGLVAFYAICVLRKLPKIDVAAMKGTRPWSCDVCMTFWAGAVRAGIALAEGASWRLAAFSAAAMSAVAFALLALYAALPPPSVGPDLPP